MPHLSVMHEYTVISGHLHVCFVTDACTYVVWDSFKYDWVSFVVFAFCVCLSQISERTKFCNLNIGNVGVHSISFMGLLIFLCSIYVVWLRPLGHCQVRHSYRKSVYWNYIIFCYVMSSAWRIDLLMVWKSLAKTCSQFLYDWYCHLQTYKWDLVSVCRISCNWIPSWKNTIAFLPYFTQLLYFVL